MKAHKDSAQPFLLKDTRVLVGRARRQASSLSSGLRALGAQVIEIPFIEIRRPRSYAPLDAALRDLRGYDWLILTSVNGVEALWDRATKLGVDRTAFAHLKIAAIGPATKAALLSRRLQVNVMPKEYIAESVVTSLKHKVKDRRVLLARARVARDVIPRELCRLATQVDVVEAYETIVPNASRIKLRALMRDVRRRPHIITFTSSSTVRNFVALLGMKLRAQRGSSVRRVPGSAASALIKDVRFASIGPVTTATLQEFGLPAHITARQYTVPGLISAIVAACSSREELA